jgi:ribosomal protein L24
MVIAGSRKGEWGTVISVEGDEGIMQSSAGVRLYHVPSLCKVADERE